MSDCQEDVFNISPPSPPSPHPPNEEKHFHSSCCKNSRWRSEQLMLLVTAQVMCLDRAPCLSIGLAGGSSPLPWQCLLLSEIPHRSEAVIWPEVWQVEVLTAGQGPGSSAARFFGGQSEPSAHSSSICVDKQDSFHTFNTNSHRFRF